MRETETIFHSVCEVVQPEYHPAGGELHPHFTVIIGTEFKEVHSNRTQLGEIWMMKWEPWCSRKER